MASKPDAVGVGGILKGAAVASAGLCLAVAAFGGSVELLPLRAPVFDLKVRDGSFVRSSGHEAHEQAGLVDNWDSSYDTGINIGVYVGTSCIFLDELLERNGHAPAAARTACVEPNTAVLPTLMENLRLQGRASVQVMHGVVSDRAHCPEGAAVLDGSDPGGAPRANASGVLMSWSGMGKDDDSFRVERCFTLEGVRAALGGKLPAVWYVDCDGCLPDIYGQFGAHFADPSVRMLLYEREAYPGTAEPEQAWEARYRAMETDLRAKGFVAKQCESNMFWGVWVWQRGGYRFTVRVWCLALWSAILIGATWCTDQLARRLPLQVAAPAWRLAVLPVWLGLHQRLPAMPYNLKEPISGLDCTWTCTHKGLGFLLSNYAFIYVAVLWDAAKVCEPRQPWLAFLCAAQSSIILGFVRHALGRQQLVPMCGGPGPQQAIWETTVFVTAVLCVAAQVRRGTAHPGQRVASKEGSVA